MSERTTYTYTTMASSPVTTPKSKHIDVRHQIMRGRVGLKQSQVVHVVSASQHADVLAIQYQCATECAAFTVVCEENLGVL